ncbi:MAG: hypothetical protein ACJAUV_000722 [Flavobacteriales bacterium]|jgi:hypothetical protein
MMLFSRTSFLSQRNEEQESVELIVDSVKLNRRFQKAFAQTQSFFVNVIHNYLLIKCNFFNDTLLL